MFEYPQNGSPFIIFFNVVLQLCVEKDIEKLEEHGNWIESLECYHRELHPVFSRANELPSEERPSPYQMFIYSCEYDLLKMIRIFYECALMRFNKPVDMHTHLANISYLRHLSTSWENNPYPIVRALRMYVVLAAKILHLRKFHKLDNELVTKKLFSHLLHIMELIFEIRDEFHTLNYVCTDNVSNSYFSEISYGIDAMLVDCDAISDVSHYSFALSSILIEKLFSFRKQLVLQEENSRAPQKKQSIKTAINESSTQICRDRIYQVDAMIRRLNLKHHPEYRDKYVKQAHDMLKETNVFDILTYCPSVKLLEPLKFTVKSIEFYYIELERLESFSAALQILTEPRKLSIERLKSVLAHRLENQYFKIKLLNFYRIFIKHMEDIDVNGICYDIKAITWITIGLSHMINEQHHDFGVDSAEFTNMLNSLTPNLIQNMFLGKMQSATVCSIVSSLLNLKMKAMLSKASNPSARESVIKQITLTVMNYMTLFKYLEPNLKANNIIMAKQFILDYFCNALMHCQTAEETMMLLSAGINFPILNLLDFEMNGPLYEFTFNFLIKIKCDGMDHTKIDDNYLEKLLSPQIDTLFSNCVNALARINEPAPRVNQNIRYFFLTMSRVILNFIARTRGPKEEKEANRCLAILNRYYEDIESRADSNLNQYLPDKIKYYPVYLSVDKSTWLDGTIAQNKKKSKNKSDERAKNNKKITTTPSVHLSAVSEATPRKYVTVESKLDDILEYCKSDINQTINYIKKYLSSRESPKIRLIALIKYAECLVKLPANRHASFLNEIEGYQRDILPLAKSYFTDQQEYNDLVKVLQSRLPTPKEVHKEPVRTKTVIPRPVSIPVNNSKEAARTPSKSNDKKSAPNPKPSASKQTQMQQSTRMTSGESKTQVSNTKRIVSAVARPSTSPPAPPPPVSPFETLYVYHDNTRTPYTVPKKFTAKQQLMVELLIKYKALPIIQGGYGLDLLLDVPFRDLDLMCFMSCDQFEKLLLENKESIGFRNRRYTKADVCVITFDNMLPNGEYEELDIACIKSLSPETRLITFIEKSLDFAINTTVYIDAQTMRVLDPHGQLNKLLHQRMIDILPGVDIDEALRKFPDRILDTIYKLAKYLHYRREFQISQLLFEAILRHANLLGRNKLIDMAKIDKLFLYGHASASLFYLHQKFKITENIFPMLKDRDISVLTSLSHSYDAYLKSLNNSQITSLMRDELRVDLLAFSMYASFKERCDVRCYYNDMPRLLEVTKSFLHQAPVFIHYQIISLITQRWINISFLSYRAPVMVQLVPTNMPVTQPYQPVFFQALPIHPINQQNNTPIPEAFICVITQQIMNKPVFCWLDRKTYEEDAIRHWLSINRTSPLTRKMMRKDQEIDDVLMPNDNLADAIAEFRDRYMKPQNRSEVDSTSTL